MPRRIVLISDLQQGSRLDALGDFEWPSRRRARPQDGRRRRLQRRPAAARRPRPRPSRPRPTQRRSGSGSPTTRRRDARAFELRLGRRARGRRRQADRRLRPAGREPGRPRAPARRRRADAVAPAEGRRARLRQHALPRGRAARRRRPSSTSATTRADDPDGLLYYLERVFRGHAPADASRSSRSRRPTPLGVRARPRRPAGRPGGRDHAGERRAGSGKFVRGRRDGARRRHRARPAPDARRAGGRPGRGRRGSARRARRDARRDRLRPSALRPARRRPVQRLHQDPFLEVSADRRRARSATSRVLARFENGDPAVVEKAARQGAARRPGQRLEPGRQPARAVVEVRPADGGAARGPRPAPVRRGEPTGRRPRAAAAPRTRPRAGRRPQAGRRGRHARAGQPRRSTETDEPGVYTVDTAARPAVVRREPRPGGEQDRAAARRDAGAVRLPAGEPRPGRRSTASSCGRCRTRSWKAARSSGAG